VAGIPVALGKVDRHSKRTASGLDFKTIHSKGWAPTIEREDGPQLIEGPAIVQYIADKMPSGSRHT